MELRAAERRLAELEDTAGIDEYKRKFEDNRKFIDKKYHIILPLTLYQHLVTLSTTSLNIHLIDGLNIISVSRQ